LLKGIFPLYLSCVYILCLIRLISSTSLSITLLLYCSKLAVHCVMLFSYTGAICSNIFHSITSSFPLWPPHSSLRE
jgi:hypothetical protein